MLRLPILHATKCLITTALFIMKTVGKIIIYDSVSQMEDILKGLQVLYENLHILSFHFYVNVKACNMSILSIIWMISSIKYYTT